MPWIPSYTESEARNAIANARSWREALSALGVTYHGKSIATLRKWADRWEISTSSLTDNRGAQPQRCRYTQVQAREAIQNSMSWAEALRRLGMCHSGGNWRLLKRRAADWNISSDHFDPRARSREAKQRGVIPLEEVLVENSTYSRQSLKRRLFESGVKKRECELCGQGEMWRGQPIGLILDHINGIRDDNRLENLQIVCPNCAAALETHCGRKNKIDIAGRECLHCSMPFRPKATDQKYCSKACGIHSPGPRDPRPELRRCERPPLDRLLQEINELGYLATGRKYGVSDNAIRKWVRSMRRDELSEAGGQVTMLIPTRTWPNRCR